MKSNKNRRKYAFCVKRNGLQAFPYQYDFLTDVYEKHPQLKELFFLKEVMDINTNKLLPVEQISYYQAAELMSMIYETGWRKYLNNTYFGL